MVRKCSLSGGDGGVALLGSGAGGRGGQKIFTFRGRWRVLFYKRRFIPFTMVQEGVGREGRFHSGGVGSIL